MTFAPSDAQLRMLRIAITVVLCASLLSCVVRGADNPADPSLAPVGSSHRVVLPGFSEARITVKATTGSLFSWCLLLAATAQLRGQGLMNVTDATLGGYDGMLFRWADADVNEPFYMRNTPLPLSLAYLDSHGQLVSAVDMAPCGDSADCPTYPPAGPYRFTIEVPQGGLARVGIEAGAVVTDDKMGCG